MTPLSTLEAQVVPLVEVEDKEYREVGAILGLDWLVVLNTHYRVQRRREHNQKTDPSNPFYGLSLRATRCCRFFKLENKEQVHRALLTGVLRPGLHQYGKVRHAEVCAWVGITPPMLVKGRPIVCPHCGGALRAPHGAPSLRTAGVLATLRLRRSLTVRHSRASVHVRVNRHVNVNLNVRQSHCAQSVSVS